MEALRSSDGRLRGTLCALDRRSVVATEQSRRLLRLFANVLAQSLDMKEDTRALRRYAVTTEERQRFEVASELHDGVVQDVVVARMLCETGAEASRDRILDVLDRAIIDSRHLIARLHPTVSTLGEFITHLEQLARSVNPAAAVHVSLPDELVQRRPDVVDAAGKVAAELLANVRKHAGGQLTQLSVSTIEDVLVLTVADDGPGGMPARSPAGQFGLTAVRCRLDDLGGEMAVHSPKAAGTTVSVLLPCIERSLSSVHEVLDRVIAT